MDEPVDSLVFSKKLRKPKGEFTLFTDSARCIRLPAPFSNSSLETAKEILAIQGSSYLRGEGMEKSIKKHDKDPAAAIKIYMSLFGLKYDESFIKKVLAETGDIVLEHKNRFNRPRPSQLAPYFGADISIAKSRSSKTPSYPGGHSAQARLVAEIYGEKYPEHRSNLLRAAEEAGVGRIMAGLHFPSDHKMGSYLGKRLFKTLKGRTKKVYNQVIDLVLK